MKQYLPWIILAAGGFILWQWWLAGDNNVLRDEERKRKDADKAGQAQESLGLGARPRMASDESLWGLDAVLNGLNPLWSQIFDDGTSSNSADKVRRQSPRSPFIYGFN